MSSVISVMSSVLGMMSSVISAMSSAMGSVIRVMSSAISAMSLCCLQSFRIERDRLVKLAHFEGRGSGLLCALG